jgi:transcriptional regulator with XRE-family HTH domain
VTRDDLAAESGVSPSYLYEVERGYKRPSTDVLASLAEALGRSPSEMLAYIEVMSEALPETPREPSSMRTESPRMESPSPETGSLRALLAVLEYMSEDDLRILLALARRLAGKSG